MVFHVTMLLLAVFACASPRRGPRDPPPSAEEKRNWRWHWEERKLTKKKFWRHNPTQEPPYHPPANWVYNTSSGPVKGKINVHIVPHTHDDTGWQVTVDQYFFMEVYYILDTVVRALNEDPNRRFMYVETGFFARWWDQQPERVKAMTRRLVQNGQLEFINGGWCMHDEAAPYYVEMVDQTTRGHIFLNKEFGSSGNPRGTWQIDPFGHSQTQAWLLSAEAGMGNLFWGRMDYLDGEKRLQDKGLEWIWRGSQSLGKSAEIFAGELYGTNGGFGYSSPMGFDGSDQQIQDDPRRHDYNVDQQVEEFLEYVQNQAQNTRSNHIIWACGGDFNYQNAQHWYHNLDKLIHYANLNGTVNAFYSTPTFYTEQKHKSGLSWEVREDDIFPLADAAHHYWTGYFTSRPALKRQVRFASNLLNAARQMEVTSKVTAQEVDTPTIRPSPRVGSGWTDSLEGTVGVATHHDGMSGTERQDVADDYEQRIAESQVEVEAGISLSLERLMGLERDGNKKSPLFSHCGCSQMNTCLNISMCAYTAEKEEEGFTVVAWSPLGRESTQLIRVPVKNAHWRVYDMGASSSSLSSPSIPADITLIDDITHRLPLLYINKYNLSPDELKKKEQEYANTATHIISFQAKDLPSVGFNTFLVVPVSEEEAKQSQTTSEILRKPTQHEEEEEEEKKTTTTTVSNGYYELEIDEKTGMLSSIKNMKSNISTSFSMQWGWYNSSTGGCTQDIPGPPQSEQQCDSQASGAYIFRPNSSRFFECAASGSRPTVEIIRGELMVEVRQTFSDWASHVIRLVKDTPYIEVEWTAGPIPIHTDWIQGEGDLGKEVSIRYNTGLKSQGVFHTDSNGREMVKRIRNGRGPSYPQPLNISEPIAGNYYPVNAMIGLEDKSAETAFVVVTDVAQGGSSINDGSLELMVHRRLLADDARGVQEPLNETMCGCNDINAPPGQMGAHGHLGDGGCWCEGLTMRGRHWLIFDNVDSANSQRRKLDDMLNFPATLAFAPPSVAKEAKTTRRDFLEQELPPNVKLMTLTDNYKNARGSKPTKTLLRLSHLYSVGEHPKLSLPASVSLAKVFSKTGLKIKSVEETSLTGNQPLKQMDDAKLIWKTHEPWNYSHPKPYDERIYMKEEGFVVTLRPMELRTFWVEFEEESS